MEKKVCVEVKHFNETKKKVWQNFSVLPILDEGYLCKDEWGQHFLFLRNENNAYQFREAFFILRHKKASKTYLKAYKLSSDKVLLVYKGKELSFEYILQNAASISIAKSEKEFFANIEGLPRKFKLINKEVIYQFQ